jgi:hypothetical protein
MNRFGKIAGLLFLVFGLVVGSVLLKQKSSFDLRKKADAVIGSQFLLKGPTEVKSGEKFDVQVSIDTMSDNQYAISGADAVVSYNLDSMSPPPAGCRYVDVQCFKAPCEKQLICETQVGTGSGSVNPTQVQAKPANSPFGMTENENKKIPREVNALQLASVTPGSLFDSYPNTNMTCGGIAGKKCPEGYYCNVVQMGLPQIIGEPSYPDVMGTCILPGPKQGISPSNPVTISGIKNYSVDENGIFQGLRGGGIFATLSFIAPQSGDISIKLNYNGLEATNDSNINGFSVNGPANIQKPVERLLTQPNELTIKVIPTKTISKLYCENPLIMMPTMLRVIEGLLPYAAVLEARNPVVDREGNGPTRYQPAVSGTDYKGIQWDYEGNDSWSSTFDKLTTDYNFNKSGDFLPKYRILDMSGNPLDSNCSLNTQYSISESDRDRPSPTPISQKYGLIRASMVFEGMQNGPLEVKLFGTTPVKVAQLLGTSKTLPDGSAVFEVGSEFLNKDYRFYLETPSHLRQYQYLFQTLKIPEANPECPQGLACITVLRQLEVDFGTLVPGDVYTDNSGQKDQLINTFDVSSSYAQWSTANQGPNKIRVSADLNGDGTVNNRDLAILLANFGKTTQIIPVTTPRKCTLDENPCNPSSCSYNLEKCQSASPTTISKPQ